MTTKDQAALVAAFEAITAGRNFVTFEELMRRLGVDFDTLLSLKLDFEAALRQRDPKLSLTSRIDLTPPGFEIRE